MKIITGTDITEIEEIVTEEELKGRTVKGVNTCEFNGGSQIMFTVALSGLSYSLEYDTNGGAGTIEAQGGVKLVVKNAKEITPPADKVFSEWNTKATGDGDSYIAGDDIEIAQNTTLYAIWGDESE